MMPEMFIIYRLNIYTVHSSHTLHCTMHCTLTSVATDY